MSRTVRWGLLTLSMLGCKEPTVTTDITDPVLEPGALEAGVASARIPAPVGIGTAGFGPFGAPSSVTPFSEMYPGTQRVLGHPQISAVALSRGEGFETIFLRVDTVGVFAQLRREIVLEASRRVGRDLDDAIILGATHTHSGPGRVLNTGTEGSSPFDLIVDTFDAGFYADFVNAAAGVVEAAMDDLRPARLGTSMGTCTDGHSDRRCEDGSYTNDAMPVLAVERDGQVDAVVLAYSVHGTMLGIDDLYLSADVSGAIEQVVEDRFDHPVEALFFNSWGADMSPANPDVELTGAQALVGDLPRMWSVGSVVADAVESAIAGATWFDEPELRSAVYRVPIDRTLIGYESGEFPFEYGAVYCTGEQPCENPEPLEDLDRACLGFTDVFPAPTQVDVSVGQIGNFALVTFPGEPGTRLAEALMDLISTDYTDVEDFLFLGYTQDYLGYSILEDDWWLGGYEASGSLWGPRQGDYLIEAVRGVYAGWRGDSAEATLPALEPFPYTVAADHEAYPAVDGNTVHTDVLQTYAAGELVEVVVRGQDPGLGAPRAWLVDADGLAVTRPGGLTHDSDGYGFELELEVDPPWVNEDGDIDRMPRSFLWTFRTTTRSQLPRGVDLSGGTYEMVVEVPQADGTTVEVRSGSFTVE